MVIQFGLLKHVKKTLVNSFRFWIFTTSTPFSFQFVEVSSNKKDKNGRTLAWPGDCETFVGSMLV